jgi:hypothetical protein
MSLYRNPLAHAIDLPGGALLAPGEEAELNDEDAEPLVEAGTLAARPEPEPVTSKRKGGES